MPANWFRVNSNGTLARIKSLFRVNSDGTLANLGSLFRVNSNGTLVKVFSGVKVPSIQTKVEISASGGLSGSTIMNDSSPITLTSTRYHWLDADGFTYIWQKSANNSTWTNIGTAQSTTNPASGASSSSITRTLSASDFTSGSDMYFRFVFSATNSTYGTIASSESLPILISYYGTPTPAPGSPSITGSTVVGNTASGNIGTWTNSPTSYDYRVLYTSGLTSYPLTYAGVKSVSSKFLSGFSAALVTSTAHGYKVNDTVIVSGMDSLFNGSHTITAKTNNTIDLTLPTPTGWSASTAYSIGDLVSYLGDAYYASIAMPAPSLFSIGNAYSVGSNAWDGFTRYRCIQSISAVSAWSSSGNYATGSVIHYNGTRWQAQQNSGPGYLIPGTSTPVGPQTPSSGNYLYWSEINVALSNTSYWQNAYPYNSSYWTLQSFSNTATSGTTTAPNYYEGTVSSSTSIPIPITTFAYKENIDLRGATTSGTGAVLNFGVKAYNQATFSPSEYLGTAFIYGVPILSIGSITPVYTTASVPFTSSYVSSYVLNLYTQPSITNVIGGASTVTYFANNTFTSGQQVTITGINPSQYNVTTTIQSATSTSFTISANITGAYVSGGTAKVTVSGYPLTVSSNTSPRSITGLSQGTTHYLEMTPANSGTTGTMQTSSFTTLIQPTISNISVSNTTPFPSSASSISVSNTAPSNTGSVSWVNESNTSGAVLYSVTGAGSGGSFANPSSLLTSGTFSVVSTGTANVSIRAINTSKTVHATWTQTNAQSYRVLYTVSGVPGTQEITGNSSSSNPSVLLGTSANTFTITSITVYPNINQGGTGVLLSAPAGTAATGADRITDTSGSGSVTFTQPTWTITWNANGGTGGGTTTQNQGSSHTAPSPGTRDGYTFANYRYPTSGGTDPVFVVSGGLYTPTADVTFGAIWSANTYTISYNGNGNTGGSTASGSYTTGGSAYTIAANGFTRTGHTFAGWNTAANGTGTSYTAGVSTYSTLANLVLYAQWTAVSYTITWSPNGGSVTPTSNSGAYGSSVTAPTPTLTGNTFLYWRDGTTDLNYANQLSAGGSWTIIGSTTFYARWSVDTYTVAFNANGGSGAPASQTKTYNQSLTLSSTAPTRTGYTFAGWNTAANGTGTDYSAGGSYTQNEAVTLYAKWTVIQYTVTWDANGGTVSPTSSTVNSGNSVTAPTPTRSGFTFSTWRNPQTGGDPVFIAAGGSYTPTINITFYAIWTAIPVVGSVSSITGSTGGRNGSLSTSPWRDPKSTFVINFANTTSATARIQRSADNSTWTSGSTDTLSVSSNTATITTNQPTGTTSASANFYYRVQVISINGTTLATPITSSSIRNTVTAISGAAVYP